MSEEKKNEGTQIPIKADDAVQAGLYSNIARISHGADAFQLDFLVVHAQPPYGRLQARVMLTPGHAKRFLRALQENVQLYESKNGDIPIPEPPSPAGYVQ